MTQPTETHVRNLLAKHGLPAVPVVFAGCQGEANATYFAGEVVVRIANVLENVGDSYTESIAAPVAHAAGIQTPRMIAFDDDRDVIDAPVTLFEKAPGGPASQGALGPLFFETLGREIARLHDRVREAADPNGWLDDHRWCPAGLLLDLRRNIGWEAKWKWSARLVTAYEAMPAPVFLHGDVHLGNLLADDDNVFTALIDWGDAGWGDPALDLGYVPAAWVPTLVRSYRQARRVDDDTLEGRVLGLLAYRALSKWADGKTDRLYDELTVWLRGPAPAGWERWWPDEPLDHC